MSQAIPERLRTAVEHDLNPVRPLAPVWRRALVVAAVATALLLASVATSHLRSDFDHIPMWLSWGAAVLELLVGVLLVGLALRESVPGAALPRAWAVLAVVTAVALQVLVAAATWMYSPGIRLGDLAMQAGFGCMRHESLLALPAFALTVGLIIRALPVRPAMAGLLGGAGCGLTSDAVDHLLCPVSNLHHVLVWHTGAIVLLMVFGWALGRIWEAWSGRRRLLH